jgi:D-alanyl-D-alanine dipeptidase
MVLKAILIAAAVVATVAPAGAQTLPDGFAFLRDIDPTILQDIRYAGSNNFMAGRLPAMARPNVW